MGSKVEGKEGFLEIFELDERKIINFQGFRMCAQGSEHSQSWRNDNSLFDGIGSSFPVFTGNVRSDEKTLNLHNSKIGHLFNDLSIRLPNLTNVPVDEILDLKSEFEKPLVNFRKKILKCSESVQSEPYTQDFTVECHKLYHAEIAPAMLEINELLKENSLLKNLGTSIVSDERFLRGTGGLVIGLFAAGAFSTVTQAPFIVSGVAASGAWLATKIIEAYKYC